ncbi:MAG: non-ribosomal peptide synthetase [Paracoccus sp. (in: a-proteobacteria)]|uniref:non-ribosomal peptide synthetase n=1 Tax=Paracoccus sp. TaxID=267 RepID=UPI003918ADB5
MPTGSGSSQSPSECRIAGLATDSQIAFLVADNEGLRHRVHVEQVLADAAADLLTPDRLRAGWERLAQDHDVLRMVLRDDETGRTRLCIGDTAQVEMRLSDWSAADETDHPALTEDLLEADRSEGADPRKGLGWRVTRIDLGRGRARMLWTIHHALTDGTSMEILLARLWDLLNGHDETPDPAPGFADAARERAEHDRDGAREFFGGMLAPHDRTALLRPQQDQAGGVMRRLRGTLTQDASQALAAVAAASGATPLNAVQAAWAMVLMRWTGQPAACMGLVDSGRTGDPRLNGTAGCLISTLPLHVDLADASSLGDLLAGLRRTTVQMRRHTHVGLTEVRRWSGLSGAVPLFDTVVMYARQTLAEALTARGCGWTGLRLVEEGDALVTLVVHGGDEMRLELEYDAARLSDDEAARMLDHVTRLLQAFGQAGPAAPLDALDMLSADETASLLSLGRAPERPAGGPPCIATRFEQIARERPDRAAVIDAATGLQLDFATLDGRANALAQQLCDADIGPEDVVAIVLPRGPDQIAAMLAVHKAAAAFLPLEPDQPTEYLARLMAGAGVRALIAAPGSALADGMLHLVPADDTQPVPPMRPPPQADRLAYLIHTSGSTGAPKAVMGLTGALAAHADAIIDRFGLGPEDRVLQFAALGFDVMLEEVWPTLLAGGTVVTRDARPLASVDGLLDLLTQHRVSVANLPAGYWHQMVGALTEAPRALPDGLRLVVTGSERVLPGAYRRWRQLAPGIAFMNGYGPTETTITCTLWQAPPTGDGLAGDGLAGGSGDLPIGRPLGHASAILRAPDGSLTPQGGQGMLWIGGPAVTRGYLNDPDQTAAAFAPDPWVPGGRLYNTGDRARWNDEGQLMFLGRGDRQLKLRGYRIDPAQIEAVLTEEPRISRAFVDVEPGPPARLLAWIVAQKPLDTAQVLRRLAVRLPHYMQPVLVPVDDMPLTPNGKIDRRALPVPARAQVTGSAPQTDGMPGDDRARLIAACMAEVLECDTVPLDAGFDEMGGDSLLALRLVSLIHRRTGWTLRATDLLRHPSPRSLAATLEAALVGAPPQPRYLVPIRTTGGGVPVFAVHVLGRNQELFRPLAAAIAPDHPVYGLTIGVPDDLSKIDIGRTARAYFDELQTSFPGQPVCLVAVSMAAYFALELAQMLRAAGREVTLLAMLDSMGPGGRPSLRGLPMLRAHLRQLRKRGLDHIREVMNRDRDDPDRPPESAPPPEGLPAMEDLIEANVAAVEAYVAQPYDGPMMVYRADRSFWDAPEALKTGLGWACVAQGGLALRDLPGTHLSILQPGNVEALAHDLRERLARFSPQGGVN